MAIDFPRFAAAGLLVTILFVLFFVLWFGRVFSERRRIRWLFLLRTHLCLCELRILLFGGGDSDRDLRHHLRDSCWLDYWEIMPNEILHHHGPLSDLERFPTMNLKFDKEIPDIFECRAFFGSGRLVLHVADERKSIVLDNVLFINTKGAKPLKKQMSRLEVRVTTDQEVSEG